MTGARWDAVLFDLDGTLADSIELILSCYRHTMRTHLGAAPEDAFWLSGLGTPLEKQLAGFARSEDEVRLMRDTYRSYQLTVHDGMVRAYPGVADLLAGLRRRRVATAVVTSKVRPIATRTLEACGLGGWFATVITPDDAARAKPDPAPVHAAMAALGGPHPDRTLFVGDAPADLIAGRAAGVRTAAALWGPFPESLLRTHAPDYMLADVAELIALTELPRRD